MSPQGTPEDRPVVDLPDPCLVLLVGPAGAGKSTFAHRHFDPEEIVSSDDLREAIAGDAADQTRNRAVFGALARAVARRLAAGGTVVVDATNLERSARRPLLAQATLQGIPAVAIVLEVRLGDAVDRDHRRRGRTVGPDVVARHHEQLGWLLASGHLDDEGFAAVHRLRGIEAVDAAVVRRAGGDHDPGSEAGPAAVSDAR